MRPLLRLAALTLAPLAAAAASSPLTEVISLPEFRVFEDRELPPPEKWDYVRLRNFEVLSSASPRIMKEFVRDLGDFENVLSCVAPQMRIHSELPVTIVLCGRSKQFERFAARPAVSSVRGAAASLVRDAEIASIVVDYEAQSVPDSRPVLSFFRGDGHGRREPLEWTATREIHVTQEFIRQYVHLSLSQLASRPPPWVAEGLANIYANIDYNNKWIEVGLPKSFANEVTVTASPSSSGFPLFGSSRYGSDGSYGYSDYYGQPSGYGGYNSGFPSGNFSLPGAEYVYQRPLTIMPMADLFAVRYDSPLIAGRTALGKFQQGDWQKQATAFVHLCLYGEKGNYRKAFLKFSARRPDLPPTEEFFKECFGLDYRAMALKLRRYTEDTRYISTVYKPTTKQGLLSPREPVVVRRATDAEIGRIKGETFRLAGQDEEARREFVVAYLRGEREPQLLASLGLMARQRHDDPRARTYLEAFASTAATVPRPRAYLELSRLRSASHVSALRPLNAGQTDRVLAPLLAAQRLPQQLSDIYLEMAAVWARSATAPTRENLATLERGIGVFPQNGAIILRTAELLVKHGYRADAAPLIQRTLDATRDPELKAKLQRLL